jgi:NAD(P)-dependent dehydrogenase (short-subunit alcohol dehydrogenase family)
VAGVLDGMGALVTGGGGGIGSASAFELAADGAAVTIMGRTEATLQAAIARLRGELPEEARVQYLVGDAIAAADIEAAVERAEAFSDGLRICVATVGGGAGSIAPMLLLDEAMLVDAYRCNVVSAFHAMKYSTPKMYAHGGGSVVCISSVAAKATSPYLSSYISAKAALEAMVRAAAVELSAFKVRVNAVRPGNTATRVRTPEEDVRAEKQAQTLPLRRIGVPADIAAGVRYLAGPESSHVTGQSFAIDGGSEIMPVAPPFDAMVRKRFGDDAIDTALSGNIAHRR